MVSLGPGQFVTGAAGSNSTSASSAAWTGKVSQIRGQEQNVNHGILQQVAT